MDIDVPVTVEDPDSGFRRKVAADVLAYAHLHSATVEFELCGKVCTRAVREL